MYIHTEKVHNLIAPNEVAPILFDMIKPTSVLDIGCGTGSWLKAFELLGITDFLGVDGDFVNRSMLQIPNEKFIALDLREKWGLEKKFDLVVSLEVAEHLEEKFADHFVNSLVLHGDVIVFSAAIPGQGGQNHLNEQWLSYWVKKFQSHGYRCFDVIRPKIWLNPAVNVWYKQNMIIFCKENHFLCDRLGQEAMHQIDMVHPDLFSFYKNQADRAILYEQGKLGIRTAFNSLLSAIANKVLK